MEPSALALANGVRSTNYFSNRKKKQILFAEHTKWKQKTRFICSTSTEKPENPRHFRKENGVIAWWQWQHKTTSFPSNKPTKSCCCTHENDCNCLKHN